MRTQTIERIRAHLIALTKLRDHIEHIREESRKTIPYQRRNLQAKTRILLLGDSSIAGVGAPPKQTIAAYLAQDYPHAHVENLSFSGARIGDILAQLSKSSCQTYTLIFINAGANDVLTFTSAREIKRLLPIVLQHARTKTETVVLGLAGKLRIIPLIPRSIKGIIDLRERRIHTTFKKIADQHHAHFIDYYHDQELNEHFLKEPEKYFSKDKFHPSGEGYRIAYQKIKKTITPLLDNKKITIKHAALRQPKTFTQPPEQKFQKAIKNRES